MLQINRQKIKRIGQTLILNTMKNKCKEILADIDEIRDILSTSENLVAQNIEDQVLANADDDNVKFIKENYSHNNEDGLFTRRDRKPTLSMTLVQKTHQQRSAISGDVYCYDDVAAALKHVGRTWNFDICMIRNIAHKDLSLVGEHLINEYEFNKLLNFDV